MNSLSINVYRRSRFCQSINQSVSQSFNQSIHQFNQSIHQSGKQTIDDIHQNLQVSLIVAATACSVDRCDRLMYSIAGTTCLLDVWSNRHHSVSWICQSIYQSVSRSINPPLWRGTSTKSVYQYNYVANILHSSFDWCTNHSTVGLHRLISQSVSHYQSTNQSTTSQAVKASVNNPQSMIVVQLYRLIDWFMHGIAAGISLLAHVGTQTSINQSTTQSNMLGHNDTCLNQLVNAPVTPSIHIPLF